MLTELYVENVAVIEKIDVPFSQGFSVITGETGAGKSILIDSINILIGERASREMIRTGSEKAIVSAVFTGLNSSVLTRLAELQFAPDEDGSLLVYREISADGKGICRINGRPATVSLLREVGKFLINIHGQHDNQSLLDPEKHIELLDEYAKNGAEREMYYNQYQIVEDIKKKLNVLRIEDGEKFRLTEMYQFQLKEINSASLKKNEDAELMLQRDLIHNSGKIAGGLNGAYESLYEGESGSAKSLIDTASAHLSAISSYAPSLKESHDKLTEISYQLADIVEVIRDIRDGMDFVEADIDKIEQRLDLIYRLKKKYGSSVNEILEYAEKIQTKLDSIENSEEEIIRLEKALHMELSKLNDHADKLTNTRKSAAVRLHELVENELTYLDMPRTSFTAKIERCGYTPNGCNTVEFLLSTNVGEEPKPLAKIASGGELSRIMLAIKSILGDADVVDTLIFDEIDTGVSGKAAQKIGFKMKRIAQKKQIVCVTHLAQIAALADNHLKISKNTDNVKTFTSVRSLQYNERIDELAQIMGGAELTETTKSAAKELLDKSNGTGELFQ